ncbi:uncharacterized protein A4U43_C05F8080 [Asparagus officinalis]|uniref:BHLH domain-containing protein n=1 Tax=Asparagus officinalis TaxID=4686 RepID=A0A5P1EQ58_ASPOF|nr:transcription factor PAR2-like [Asparagus officinalis]ONK68155.1 uncharacterized protein A4U43_C05F8080 [Asparagus officinalis]
MHRASSCQWSRALCRRIVRDNSSKSLNQCKRSRKDTINDCDLVSRSDDGVERRIKDLQRLVPGGGEMEVDDLFEETADYIEALKGQVNLMRALTEVLDGASRERRTMGG